MDPSFYFSFTLLFHLHFAVIYLYSRRAALASHLLISIELPTRVETSRFIYPLPGHKSGACRVFRSVGYSRATFLSQRYGIVHRCICVARLQSEGGRRDHHSSHLTEPSPSRSCVFCCLYCHLFSLWHLLSNERARVSNSP